MEKEEGLESLNISTKTRKLLENNGYRTIGDLLRIEYEEELSEIYGMGKKVFKK